MLDTETKRRIDTCRDILVGKVPDPKSQVEQITIALIYKFMDDMDSEAAEFGGKRSFFINGFEKYSWSNLLAPRMGGQDTLNLYSDAIDKMTENTHLPELFRDIFKNAYLPYRDPETLRAFLKEIDTFKYDHSERLGDAFEYLLSVLGSQGDAGQFRTPRHIIDFIVAVVDPKKNETILDPACGTAGFLISAWKHILKHNTKQTLGDALKPDEKKKLAKNIRGYDISPDMVRLSLVNLYLHGFTDPHVYEYDTLTSEERWNEFYDVILANPPFMSPKGGIKPHKRFSIQAKRSEVLFVDYMAEHLSPKGRAGIIIPEGIIFQSQGAYKELRKMLVEKSLVAVVSLPAGCFNPYSGVKTSILILDKQLAKKASTIAFFKVENDGFGLGSQRRAFDKNDLPRVRAELDAYLQALRSGSPLEPSLSGRGLGEGDLLTTGLIVPKEKIAANGDYNLSGERYREGASANHEWPLVELGNVARLINGRAYKQEELLPEGTTPVLRVGNFFSNRGWYYSDLELEPEKYCNPGDLLFAWSASFGPRIWDGPRAIYHYHIWKVEPTAAIDKMFLFYLLASEAEKIKSEGNGIAMVHATKGGMEKRKFPLPPLEVQKEIVAEIESYQKVINGAHAVLDNYRPHIPLHHDWPMVKIGNLVTINNGYVLTELPAVGEIACVKVSDMNLLENQREIVTSSHWLDSTEKQLLPIRSVVFPKRGAAIATNKKRITKIPCLIDNNCMGLTVLPNAQLDPYFLFNFLLSFDLASISNSAGIALINNGDISTVDIPLPPIATQQAIVAEIEAEQALVAANRELITRFEKKIRATLARVWGEEDKPKDGI